MVFDSTIFAGELRPRPPFRYRSEPAAFLRRFVLWMSRHLMDVSGPLKAGEMSYKKR